MVVQPERHGLLPSPMDSQPGRGSHATKNQSAGLAGRAGHPGFHARPGYSFYNTTSENFTRNMVGLYFIFPMLLIVLVFRRSPAAYGF